jgi:hypothetical protein
MVSPLLLVVGIMLGAGVLGGIVNFYLAKPDDVPPPNMARSVIVGTAASLLVPLFLNMISSELVDKIKGGDEVKPFVLLGFCLVAAISSTAFIRTLSDRVLDEAKQATKVAKEAKADARQVDRKIELIEDLGNLPGSKKGLAPALAVDTEKDDGWNTDPNKGQFGGAPEANSRVLEATITPAAGPSSAGCSVLIRVRSTDTAKPLTGDVTFYLHPTFGKWARYTVPVKGGKAEDTITSWGSFTVGAVADNGDTRLELDLASVAGGTTKFYAQ